MTGYISIYKKKMKSGKEVQLGKNSKIKLHIMYTRVATPRDIRYGVGWRPE